jgi:hypothetical protein
MNSATRIHRTIVIPLRYHYILGESAKNILP